VKVRCCAALVHDDESGENRLANDLVFTRCFHAPRDPVSPVVVHLPGGLMAPASRISVIGAAASAGLNALSSSQNRPSDGCGPSITRPIRPLVDEGWSLMAIRGDIQCQELTE
jgi:hypothetical protein